MPLSGHLRHLPPHHLQVLEGPTAGLVQHQAGTRHRRAAGLAVTALGAVVFSALGLWFGTAVPPQQISVIFLLFAPMIFFGCAYFPWQGLAKTRALQIAVLVNPLTFVSEGMRGALTPMVPHMPLPWSGAALLVLASLLTWVGLRSFDKRAIA